MQHEQLYHNCFKIIEERTFSIEWQIDQSNRHHKSLHCVDIAPEVGRELPAHCHMIGGKESKKQEIIKCGWYNVRDRWRL